MKKIYQIKISLDSINPLIWRRILINDNITLDIFHLIIQVLFNWENYHLYQFEYDGRFYGDTLLADDFDVENDSEIQLKDFLRTKNDRIEYEYDFGDSWRHIIILEKIIDIGKISQNPICIDGARNSPPEDCGGFPGYYHMIETMKKPRSKECKELVEWLGGKYNPELFEINMINKGLKKLKIK